MDLSSDAHLLWSLSESVAAGHGTSLSCTRRTSSRSTAPSVISCRLSPVINDVSR